MPYDDRSPKPFILRIVVPYGDPEGIRTIDDPNWTGKGVVFPRSEWGKAQERPELEKAGVYILSGTNLQATDDDLPSIYIGQTDGIKNRIDKHSKDKPFWDKAIAFVSNELNRAHITWLESVLVQRAKEINRCRLENNNEPHVPNLGEADKIVAENFLNKILQILPLVGLPIFEKPRVFNSAESTDLSTQGHTPTSARTPVADEQIQEADTIIVSSDYIGIQTVFLRKKMLACNQDCWRQIEQNKIYCRIRKSTREGNKLLCRS